jgi:hypothetical protein
MAQREPVRIANCSGFYGDRIAAQAKGLGEYLRSRVVTAPSSLITM